jgi:hypothetical protein
MGYRTSWWDNHPKPNANKPWASEDDAWLLQNVKPHLSDSRAPNIMDFLEGDVRAAAVHLGRTRDAIRARLTLHCEEAYSRHSGRPLWRDELQWEKLHDQWRKTGKRARLLFLRRLDQTLIDEARKSEAEPETIEGEVISPRPLLDHD